MFSNFHEPNTQVYKLPTFSNPLFYPCIAIKFLRFFLSCVFIIFMSLIGDNLHDTFALSIIRTPQSSESLLLHARLTSSTIQGKYHMYGHQRASHHLRSSQGICATRYITLVQGGLVQRAQGWITWRSQASESPRHLRGFLKSTS